MLAKEGIVGIRRAKKRNMERLTKACGGNAVNAVDELSINDLGFCELVHQSLFILLAQRTHSWRR